MRSASGKRKRPNRSRRPEVLVFLCVTCAAAGTELVCPLLKVHAWPVAKRQHRHEEIKSSYISGRATSFAERQVERRLAEACKVQSCALLSSSFLSKLQNRRRQAPYGWQCMTWDCCVVGVRNPGQEEGNDRECDVAATAAAA